MHVAGTESPRALVLLRKPEVDQIREEKREWREAMNTTLVSLVRTTKHHGQYSVLPLSISLNLLYEQFRVTDEHIRKTNVPLGCIFRLLPDGL